MNINLGFSEREPSQHIVKALLFCMTAFPPEALLSFIGTMQSSDYLQPVCLPSLIRLSGIPLIHYCLLG